MDMFDINNNPSQKRKRNVNKLAVRIAKKNGNGQPVSSAANARDIVTNWIEQNLPNYQICTGLPEVDDRYEAWRVSLLDDNNQVLGELMISCSDGRIIHTTKREIILSRLIPQNCPINQSIQIGNIPQYTNIANSTIVCGDSRAVLGEVEDEFFSLVITSPPYYNAKPEYSEYTNYQEYLSLLTQVFEQCHRTLLEGRFIIVNASPVLVRRPSRNKSSKRIPVPFHINEILENIGFDFIDDIIWAKPSGAGWNTGRGRRFAADRNPLQYKPVPITEYFLVYRKKTDKLIDWNIRNHPDQEAVKQSKIEDGYEVTNLWYEKPSHHQQHPATFPVNIIEKLISYYSFKNELVLDPFAGIGTVGKAAITQGRRFFLIDNESKYCNVAIKELTHETEIQNSRIRFTGI